MQEIRRLGPHDGYNTHRWMLMFSSEGYPHVGSRCCDDCDAILVRYWYRMPSVGSYKYPVIGICPLCGQIQKLGDYYWNQISH